MTDRDPIEVARAALELVARERAQGPGLAKAGDDPVLLRWRGQSHAKQLHKIGRLKRLGWNQAEIARGMHISDTHLSKLISDGFSKGNRFMGEHIEALDELLLEATVEAANCG